MEIEGEPHEPEKQDAFVKSGRRAIRREQEDRGKHKGLCGEHDGNHAGGHLVHRIARGMEPEDALHGLHENKEKQDEREGDTRLRHMVDRNKSYDTDGSKTHFCTVTHTIKITCLGVHLHQIEEAPPTSEGLVRRAPQRLRRP